LSEILAKSENEVAARARYKKNGIVFEVSMSGSANTFVFNIEVSNDFITIQ